MMKKLITLLLSISLLTACGWQLRGSLNLPADLKSLYINSVTKNSFASAELKRLLSANDIQISETAESAQYTIKLSNEREERRTISVSSSGLAAEYELTYEVDYSIINAQNIIVAPTSTARVIRSYNYDREDVIAKDQEEELIKTEMKRQLATQILNRLRFASTAKGVTKAEPDSTAVE